MILSAFKEIVTKAVIGKGKKYYKNAYTIETEHIPTTVLGCWVINHSFKGTDVGGKIVINGSFDINLWYKYIDRYINKAKRRKLFEIEYVPITQNELDKIKEVKNPQKERLLFTLLSLAKLNNLKSETNNNWVNYDEKIIFQLARVSCSDRNRNIMIYELKEAGYVKNSKRSLNIQVCFIDNSSTPVLRLTDMRELGYQYEELKKKTLIRRCSTCGKPFRLKSQKDRTRLCFDCKKKDDTEKVKIKHCEICGEPFFCDPRDGKSSLCNIHRIEAERERKRLFIHKKREESKM